MLTRMWLRLAALTVCMTFALPAWAAANITAKGFVNGQDIDKADSPKTAIVITEPVVNGEWRVGVSGESVTFTKAFLDLAGFVPSREFNFKETIPAGGRNDGSGSMTLPETALALKGYYNIRVFAEDEGGRQRITKTFWVALGEGNPATGIVGGVGAALAAVSLGMGFLAARAAKGLFLGLFSSLLMALATPFLLVATGAVSPLQTPAFLGAALGAGIGENVLIRLASRFLK